VANFSVSHPQNRLNENQLASKEMGHFEFISDNRRFFAINKAGGLPEIRNAEIGISDKTHLR